MRFLRRSRFAFSSCVRAVGKRLRMQRLLSLLGGSGLHFCSPLGDTSKDAIEYILQHFQLATCRASVEHVRTYNGQVPTPAVLQISTPGNNAYPCADRVLTCSRVAVLSRNVQDGARGPVDTEPAAAFTTFTLHDHFNRGCAWTRHSIYLQLKCQR